MRTKQLTAPRDILGIPCDIGSPRVRRAIRRVLGAVWRHPRDLGRLRRRVLAFRYLDAQDEGEGCWCLDPAAVARLAAVASGAHEPRQREREEREQERQRFLMPGYIMLSRRVNRISWGRLVATIAHACGHAVTRLREYEARELQNDSESEEEWARELLADRHTFRWGFEREMRMDAPYRSLAHHAVLPGEMMWVRGRALKCDRNFYLRRCPSLDEPGAKALEVPDVQQGSAVSAGGRTR